MILEFDLGNSNVKWRLRDKDRIEFRGSCPHSGKIDYDNLIVQPSCSPEYVHVVSVLTAEQERFSRWCYSRWGLSPRFAEVLPECAGVKNAYYDVSQMGPDRWLAMVAAHHLVSHDCLVIDSGSACTVDLVLASGQHLGGYIVPGLELMRDALFRDTDRVKLPTINYDSGSDPGHSTSQAVASGLQVMQLGLVSVALDKLVASGTGRPVIMLTGGGSQSLAGLLEAYLLERCRRNDVSDIVLRPDLVFEGLPFVLK